MTMNAHEKYNQFRKDHFNDEPDTFFANLAKEFGVSDSTAYDIWYAPQRSWYKPEMMDEIVRLDKVTDEFFPNYYSGSFDWDEVNKKFIPEKE